MTLETGDRLGRYEILGPLGAGGMGEVYRAHDERLDRDVAIKVLPGEVAQDEERLARFEREAKLLASLSHQNIATLYGLETVQVRATVIPSEERSDGARDLGGGLDAGRALRPDSPTPASQRDVSVQDDIGGVGAADASTRPLHFLVMELVKGEDLATRMMKGPIPLDEALPIARQIAEGLEAAHEQGIIHRDLKPANVMLSPEGKVKILDFGLAKAWQPEDSDADLTHSPTLTAQMTAAGVLLGTAAYMSPEQARGKPVDKRADIWAFGAVLWEMLTGESVFRGETVTDVLAAVIKSDPGWGDLPDETPARVREVLRRCLAKDPRRRLRDIGDALWVLEEAEQQAAAEGIGRAQQSRRWLWLPVGALALIALALLLWALRPAVRLEPAQVARLVMPLPHDAPFHASERSSLAVSRDGSRVVYVAGRMGESRLIMRALVELEAAEVPETEGAVAPFFSPDGSWIGYFTKGSVNKVAVTGGTHHRVADAPPVSRGAHWNAESTILFSPNKTAGLAEVSDDGGPYKLVTQPDIERHAGGHCWPQLFPGTRSALVTILPPGATSYDEAHVAAIDLASGKQSVLIEGGSYGRYAASGHLLFVRRGSLLAAAFDLDRLEVTSPPVPVIEGVLSDPSSGVAHFAVSDTGTLVYAPGGQRPSSPRSLVLVDRDGNTEPVGSEPAGYAWPRFSPDGRQLAVVIEGSTDDIWVLDLERGAMRRLTFEGRSVLPIWSPDGLTITYSSVRADFPALYSVTVDGSGEPRHLVGGDTPTFACSWSPDGELIAYTAADEGTSDIYLLPRDGSPRPFLATRFNEGGAKFSPDGRWIAYISDESGRFEVYLRRHPDTGAKWQVSTAGGRGPQWAPDGREISFQAGDSVFAVTVETEPELRIGAPAMLFDEPIAIALPDFANYDLSPDGRRFVIVQDAQAESQLTQLVVVLNWLEELKRFAPTE